MKIMAAETLRGELVLHSINKTLTKGQITAINEESYWNQDIQLMLRSGRISLVEGEENIPVPAEGTLERVSIQSRHPRALVLKSLPYALKFGQVYTMSARDFKNLDVQQALIYKLIVQISAEEAEQAEAEFIDMDEQPLSRGDTPMSSKAIKEEMAQKSKTKSRPVVKEDESDPQMAAAIRRARANADATAQQIADGDATPPEDEADRFHRTGKAQVIDRASKPKVPENMYVYDPHGEMARAKRTPEGMHAYDPHAQKAQDAATVTANRRAAAKTAAAKAAAAAAAANEEGDPPLVRPGARRMRTEGEQRRAIKPAGRVRRSGEVGGGEELGGDGVDIEML